jgi:hypothetical protein
LVFWNNWSRVPMPYPDLSILFFWWTRENQTTLATP